MLGDRGEQREGPQSVGLSKSDWASLEVVDLHVEALQIGILEAESRLRRELEFAKEDQDRELELAAILDALWELKAATREMRAWAASIAACD
jgi:hypothetical protein